MSSGDPRPLLVIAYKFPPYAGVGGFRWAKLTKYLARIGHRVHVLTVPWEPTGPNAAAGLAAEPGVEIHPIASGGPHRLRHRPIANRWLHAARHYAIRAVDSRLYWDDEAQRWPSHLLPAAHRLISEHGIEVVVATGHPFQANRWAAELKRQRPGLKLVQDFRDPWAENPFRPLPVRRAEAVRTWQCEALAAADAIVSVTPRLLALYECDAPAGTPSLVINNGADPEAVPTDSARTGAYEPGQTICLTHVGNISNGRDRPLNVLLDAIRALPPGSPRVEVWLVGAQVESVRRAHSDLERRGQLVTRPALRQCDALRLVAASTYGLQLNAREFPFALSTKIYEYALLGVPVISLNYGGDVADLIATHGFGHSLDLGTGADLDALLRSLPDRAAADRAGRFRFDVEPFTYPVLAGRYSELVQSL